MRPSVGLVVVPDLAHIHGIAQEGVKHAQGESGTPDALLMAAGLAAYAPSIQVGLEVSRRAELQVGVEDVSDYGCLGSVRYERPILCVVPKRYEPSHPTCLSA